MSSGHRLWAAFALLLVPPSSGQKPPGEVWLKADFGAIGDGTSDDAAAVHAFLAACETAACRMEPGRYRVTAAPKIAIDNDATADRIQIIAEPFGKVAHNWTRSSIILPDGSILK